MSEQERVVLACLADAWNEFIKLPAQHPHEQQEFMHAIHRLQDLVAARAAYREEGYGKPITETGNAFPWRAAPESRDATHGREP